MRVRKVSLECKSTYITWELKGLSNIAQSRHMLYLHLNDGLQSFGFCRLRRPFKAPMQLLK